LIVNPFGIGDVLFSTPLVRAIRQAFPKAYVGYLCNRRTQEILRRNPNLDELFVYEKDEFVTLWKQNKRAGFQYMRVLLAQIRGRRFDMVVDLSLGERYSLILAALGVKRRVGFDFRNRGRFLTHRFTVDGYQDEHVVEYYARLLAWLGIRMSDRQLELAARPDDEQTAANRFDQLHLTREQRFIGLVPAGGVSWGLQAHFRRWPKEGFIDIGRTLSERYYARIVVFGEARDRDVCAEIAQAIGPAAVDLSGETTLREFIQLVARCHLVVSNDGGPIHIAASQGVPTVSIFGPVDPDVYGPYPRTSQHRIVYKPDLPCRPCYHQFKLPPCPYERACLSDIDPSDVLEACEQVLARRADAHDAATARVSL